jgi:hypothetical protein
MSIDGIGKPPGAPPGVGGAGGVGEVGKSGESFQVGEASAVEGPAGSDDLGRLQRGEISVDDYVDSRVEHATEHLAGKLPTEQLEFVKNALREQIATDPVLLELVRRATGGLSSAP